MTMEMPMRVIYFRLLASGAIVAAMLALGSFGPVT
jgi:hypothetical protein